MPGESTTYLVVLLSLLVVTAAGATPTVSNCNTDFVPCTVRAGSDMDISAIPEVVQTTESGDSHLAAVAAEYLKPPASFTNPAVAPAGVKPLPPIPKALLMVLTGFLYVSLVKDRRVWLAALTGLLWAGQVGLQALPQLAVHLRHRNSSEQQFSAQLTYPYYLENYNRLRSDIEGTQYIGLLHHLAGIPNRRNALRVTQLGGAGVAVAHHNLCAEGCNCAHKSAPPSQRAIIPEQYSLDSSLNCLALRVKQFVCFSPELAFDIVSRGPPS